jgi:hypothetical protein
LTTPAQPPEPPCSLEVAERGRHFAEVAKFQGALPHPAARYYRDGVGGATVDLNERDEALPVLSGWVVQPEEFQPVEREAQTEDLSGAHVPVGLLRQGDVLVERLQHIGLTELATIGREIRSPIPYYRHAGRTAGAACEPRHRTRTPTAQTPGCSTVRASGAASWLGFSAKPSRGDAVSSSGRT